MLLPAAAELVGVPKERQFTDKVRPFHFLVPACMAVHGSTVHGSACEEARVKPIQLPFAQQTLLHFLLLHRQVRTFAYGTDASFYRLNPKMVVKVCLVGRWWCWW